jgi:hypothetical protein
MRTAGKNQLFVLIDPEASAERLIRSNVRQRLIKLDIAGHMNACRIGP